MKILVCVGGMPCSDLTVQFGELIADLYQATMTLLTVVDNDALKPEATQTLSRLARQADTEAEMKIVQRETAVQGIVDECQTGRYDLVVIGTRIIHGISLSKSSTIAQRVTKKVPIPVFVVKEEPVQLQRILICTSGQDQGLEVIQAGLKLASLTQAEVRLLYVADPLPQMYVGLETMEETVEELLASGTPIAAHLQQAREMAAAVAVPMRILKRHGIIIDQILLEIEESHYDLVVIGATQHENFWQALTLGNVSPYIVENASCSVMVIHS